MPPILRRGPDTGGRCQGPEGTIRNRYGAESTIDTEYVMRMSGTV